MAGNYWDNRMAHYSSNPDSVARGDESKYKAVKDSKRGRSGDLAKVGGQDYSGMAEDDVRASRVARIREIFAGLRGKAAKQEKPAGSKPRASGGKTGGSAAGGPAKLPPMPPAEPRQQFLDDAESWAQQNGMTTKPIGPPPPPGFYDKAVGAIQEDPGLAAALGVTAMQTAPQWVPGLGSMIGGAATGGSSALGAVAPYVAPGYVGYRLGDALAGAFNEEVQPAKEAGGRRSYLDTLSDVYRMLTQPRASLSQDIPPPPMPAFDPYTK